MTTRKKPSRRKTMRPPVFRDLTKEECESVLACNHVGRMAYSFHDAVDIRPVNYVFDDTWLFGRTSPGDKLITLQHHQWVAFEVDEIAGPFDWKSVVARGTFYRLDPDGAAGVELYDRALSQIQKLTPEIFTATDPVPFRTELFGISLNEMTGRTSSTKSKA